MKESKKSIRTIKEIIFITLALIILGIIINFIYTNNEWMQVAETPNNIELGLINTQKKDGKVTSRSQTGFRRAENKNEEIEEKQDFEEVVVFWEEPPVEEPKIQYKTIEEVTISKDMDLTVRTGLSKESFKELISSVREDTSKFFYENSDTIYDLCEKYELNEIFFCGLISAESGWNIASNHRNTHNYISLMVNGKLLKYDSVEDGLEVAAKSLHNNYLTEGGKFYYGKTLSAVKTRFCPASSTWVNLVFGRMKQIKKV
ncbi:MAG: hypothetical protein IJH39_07570 [Clostridia bacterium]|nr:hypothetical protein [Clostridia bacterium]